MEGDEEELIHFADEDGERPELPGLPWRVLVVDDDAGVHRATAFALESLSFFDRPVELLSAYSGNQALDMLRRESGIAAILLDVVMETPTAGLDIVARIRDELGLRNLRIILRTGQPGYAPELETIRRYDINDYKSKNELTRTRLYVTLAAALRTYDQLCRSEAAAHTDTLTGLPNRNALLDFLGRCLQGKACDERVLMLIDIDKFSVINDMFGHDYGDRLLLAVAQRLVDRLSPDALVARIGDDIFALFGKGESVRPDRVRALFAEPFRFDDVEHLVSITTGALLLADRQADDLTGALKDAWIALKRAKMNGQGQDAWFTPSVGAEAREHGRLLHGLRDAFRLERLFLVYQPQIDLASGRVVGVEALLRWRGEDGRYISPERFIPIAESSGLIVDLGSWVLRTALHAANELGRSGHAGFTMAVNVSAAQCAHPGFLDTLDEALALRAAAAPALELEITESVALLGIEPVECLLREVKRRGISVAIDDFGTGYSSLSYLNRLPADRLKIDRSFVGAMQSGERGERIAEMMIPLGNRLGMKVLAEGVETEEQANRLRQLGCHEAQGYLYARPMPLPELVAWLGEQVSGRRIGETA